MKRTEMILQIKDIVNRSLNQDHILEPDADRILTRLEEAGMRPPRLPEDFCQAIMHVYYAGYTFNQWEEEIEKDEKVMEVVRERRRRAALTPEERKAERVARLEKRRESAVSRSEMRRLDVMLDAEKKKPDTE